MDTNKWISVDDRPPEIPIDKKGYLCRCVFPGNPYDFYMVLNYIACDENPHFQHERQNGLQVTHWQPLPEPPKEDNHE